MTTELLQRPRAVAVAAASAERVFGRGRQRMVTGPHVDVFREASQPGERRRYTKRFLATPSGDYRCFTEREWRILARLVGHGVGAVPDIVRFDRGGDGQPALIQTYDVGVTVDHWATLLPVARGGAAFRHAFEDAPHWFSLARHALAALDAVHALAVVHLDLKADNVCIPVSPPGFDPREREGAVRLDMASLALIDFAFALVSGERLATALPIARHPDHDYQSPRLLAALEAGLRGDLAPTRELDWRCDFYSLAAMLDRYLPPPEAHDAGGWTRACLGEARVLVGLLRRVHDAALPAVRPHAALIERLDARLAEPRCADSLARGFALEVAPADPDAEPDGPDADDPGPTPVTRIAPAIGATSLSAPRSAAVSPTAFAVPGATAFAAASRVGTMSMSTSTSPSALASASTSASTSTSTSTETAIEATTTTGISTATASAPLRATTAATPLRDADTGRPIVAVRGDARTHTADADEGPLWPGANAGDATDAGAAVAPPRRIGVPTARGPTWRRALAVAAAAAVVVPALAAAWWHVARERDAAAAGTALASLVVAVPPADVAPAPRMAPEPAVRPSERAVSEGDAHAPLSTPRDATSPDVAPDVAPAASGAVDPPLRASVPSPSRDALEPEPRAGARSASLDPAPRAAAASPVRETAQALGGAASSPRAAVAIAAAPRPSIETPARPEGRSAGAPKAPPASTVPKPAAGRASVASAPPVRATIASAQRTVAAPPSPSRGAGTRAAPAPLPPFAARGREATAVAMPMSRRVAGSTPPVAASVTPARTAALARAHTAALAASPSAEPDATRPVEAARPIDAAPAPVGDAEHGRRGAELLASWVPQSAQRAERRVLRVLHVAAQGDGTADDDAVRQAARAIRLAPGDSAPAPRATDARRLADDARAALRRGAPLDEAIALQTSAFGADPANADIAGTLAAWTLLRSPGAPEPARRLALHALALPDAGRPQGRLDDWTTFAVASSLSGRAREARHAWAVALAVAAGTNQQGRVCRAGLDAVARHGERLRAPVEAMLQRLHAGGDAGTGPSAASPYCEWPPHWESASR